MAIQYPMACRKVSEDGRYRLTVHYDECAEHPLVWCDFPLHMDDWCRDYSANPTRFYRNDPDRLHYDSKAKCMRDLLNSYCDGRKVVEHLIANGKKEFHGNYDEALIYDRSRREWLLMQWEPAYRTYDGERIEAHWSEYESFACKREAIDLYSLTYYMGEECLADLLEHCLTDEVKVMSYGFGYHGSIGFYSNVSPDAEGLAWLVKSEAVGAGKWLTEEQWRTESCYELSAGEREEICAWADGDVYYFEVEKNVRWKVHRECLSEDREDEDYEDEEWEHVDSCSGFYSLDSCVRSAIECNKLPNLIEAA